MNDITEADRLSTINPPECWLDAPTTNIMDAFCKTNRYIYLEDGAIVCSISGGADSDVMLDMVHKIDRLNRVQYVFFDTGLKMQATKNHIRFLESKYNISIDVVKPKKSIPIACKEFGQPFFSKNISESIERLQRHGFKWEDEPLDVLLERYPKCKAALRWWCNDFGENSRFNISKQPFLKEFMHEHPPQFKISPKCCTHAKKAPAKDYESKKNAHLTLIGIRKAEGGARSTAYESCFYHNSKRLADMHFPLFWFTDNDKAEYDRFFGVTHSAAYTIYGCKRTGCAACPFGSKFEDELAMLQTYEPNLYKAAMNIFGESIEYTRAYRRYKSERAKSQTSAEQITLDETGMN